MIRELNLTSDESSLLISELIDDMEKPTETKYIYIGC
jgi:hypothetical protein